MMLGGTSPVPTAQSTGSIGGGTNSLAAEVLPLAGLLAQGGAAAEGEPYIFPISDDRHGPATESTSQHFELSRDDTMELLGLLNSSDLGLAQREFGLLLGRLGRSAVEGLTQRLLQVLRRQKQELTALEYEASKFGAAAQKKMSPPTKKTVGGSSSAGPTPVASSSGPVNNNFQPHQRIPQPPPPVRNDAAAAVAAAASVAQRKAQQPPLPPQAPLSARGTSSSAARLPLSARGPSAGASSRLQQPRQRGTSPVATASSFTPSDVSAAAAAKVSAPPKDHSKVFRRLSAPPSAYNIERRGSHDSSGLPKSPSTTILTQGDFSQATAATDILGAALAARDEDLDWGPRPMRVSEEKAKEIFDRLYKSGQQHRVRRRVYHELGLLVDQAKHDQTCTFMPSLPLAAGPACGSVTERLYRDGLDRRRRREELSQQAPLPTFHPSISESSHSLQQSLGISQSALSLLSPAQGSEDSVELPPEHVEELGVGPMSMSQESRHERLFREHEERRARKMQREEDGAEWKKHSFRPDISTSQITGPRVLRQRSAAALLQPSRQSSGSSPMGTGATTVGVTVADNSLVNAMPRPILGGGGGGGGGAGAGAAGGSAPGTTTAATASVEYGSFVQEVTQQEAAAQSVLPSLAAAAAAATANMVRTPPTDCSGLASVDNDGSEEDFADDGDDVPDFDAGYGPNEDHMSPLFPMGVVVESGEEEAAEAEEMQGGAHAPSSFQMMEDGSTVAGSRQASHQSLSQPPQSHPPHHHLELPQSQQQQQQTLVGSGTLQQTLPAPGVQQRQQSQQSLHSAHSAVGSVVSRGAPASTSNPSGPPASSAGVTPATTTTVVVTATPTGQSWQSSTPSRPMQQQISRDQSYATFHSGILMSPMISGGSPRTPVRVISAGQLPMRPNGSASVPVPTVTMAGTYNHLAVPGQPGPTTSDGASFAPMGSQKSEAMHSPVPSGRSMVLVSSQAGSEQSTPGMPPRRSLVTIPQGAMSPNAMLRVGGPGGAMTQQVYRIGGPPPSSGGTTTTVMHPVSSQPQVVPPNYLLPGSPTTMMMQGSTVPMSASVAVAATAPRSVIVTPRGPAQIRPMGLSAIPSPVSGAAAGMMVSATPPVR
eukprot:CAMPEP_0206439438 /NCGR_PEP_ID=MMETSP0324_2-20121206/12203_1 /ASSEMBLY_ACC=CAM_ASM_000836 /TAXON_ID=2866 /ORGANISM="Crypthecodinium cohnii, Strain Seligo" /LENGTH=1108 /DNA_ID=CAMNT_0053907043 /DNA_START=273 /DNA_END=3599 /DNA_ORIENTATION=-